MTNAKKTAQDCEQVTVAERITIALIPKAAAGLAALQARTGLGKTDLANRAISLYEFTDAQMRDHDLILRDRRTGETQLVKFL